jgi:hypothetical protein
MDLNLDSDSNDKIQIIKSLWELECEGIKFDKHYTILDDIIELKLAYEYGKKIQTQIAIQYELKQFGQLVGLGFETITPIYKKMGLSTSRYKYV